MPNNRFIIEETTPVDNFSLLFFKLITKVKLDARRINDNRDNSQCNNLEIPPTTVDYLLNPECYQFNRNSDKLKPHLLRKIVDIFNSQGGRRKVYTPFVDQYVKTLEEEGFKFLKFKTGYNLAVGLGLPSFFENGLTFHHTYGVPYLPASSVKGLLRYSFWGKALGIYPFGIEAVPKPFELLTEDEREAFKVISKLDELTSNAETFDGLKKALTKKVEEGNLPVKVVSEEKLKKFFEIFKTLFGTQKVRGKVIFADALAKEFKLGVDITNPHFKDYYQLKEKHPVQIAEIYNPVPVHFLVVEDATFIAPYKILDKGRYKTSIIDKLLKEAFELLGIGGKRRKGYGILYGTENRS
ncbi:MAG: type III-B CRISPR module RAMP protein Cmr6 [Aquificae bacterium]|nr:type III-B CRISPR module RAMP protein Cmr6 [Aquificota bacterium]